MSPCCRKSPPEWSPLPARRILSIRLDQQQRYHRDRMVADITVRGFQTGTVNEFHCAGRHRCSALPHFAGLGNRIKQGNKCCFLVGKGYRSTASLLPPASFRTNQRLQRFITRCAFARFRSAEMISPVGNTAFTRCPVLAVLLLIQSPGISARSPRGGFTRRIGWIKQPSLLHLRLSVPSMIPGSAVTDDCLHRWKGFDSSLRGR